jgi:ELWxxDGT repeat protein
MGIVIAVASATMIGCSGGGGTKSTNTVKAPAVIPLCVNGKTNPWVSDGTPEGTVMLKDLNASDMPKKLGGNDHNKKFVPMGDIVFFPARIDNNVTLWRSDGTAEGTVMLHDFDNPGDGLAQMVVMGDHLYFRGWDEEHGYQIWKSDGTAEGTVRVTDLNGSDNWVCGLRSVGSYVTFVYWIDVENRELRKTTGSGSELIKTFQDLDSMKAIDGKLYFRGYDGGNGYEPWVSDGTESGTVMLKDIYTGSDDSDTYGFIKLGEYVYFIASKDGNDSYILYRVNPATNAVEKIHPFNTDVRPMTVYKSVLLLGVQDANGGLYVYDGTNTPVPLTGGMYFRHIIPVGDTVFLHDDSEDKLYAWNGNTDDIEVNTVELETETNATRIHNFRVQGDELWFIVDTEENGSALWRSDGTQAGTVRIKGGLCDY